MTLKDFLDKNQDLFAEADMFRFKVGFYNKVIPICNITIISDLEYGFEIFDPYANESFHFCFSQEIDIKDNQIIVKNILNDTCCISFYSLRPINLRED